MNREIVLFNGTDASGNRGLWETDGYAAGTTEIGGLGDSGVSGAYSGGLGPVNLTFFNGKVLFEGADASSDAALWASNGTAAGTTEIGGLANSGVSGVYSGGLFCDLSALGFTVFNGEVLFAGDDANGDVGLWATNGTAAGTTEIGGLGDSGVSDAYSLGLQPSDPTVFNGEVLFEGADSSGDAALWATNGTAAGTTEIGGLANSGVSGGNSGGLGPLDLTVFNGEVLFEGDDASGNHGLWATNGTAAGTTEIGGLGNSGVSGAYSKGLTLHDLTVLNGEALFAGYDAGFKLGLWVTNGTAAGTTEIGGLDDSGVSAAGPNGLLPGQLAVFNDEVLFKGTDASGNRGLWMTNGTAAGTTEIGGLGDSGVVGAQTHPGLKPNFLTVFNGEVLFEGTDANGNLGLWETNGTAAGTFEIGGLANSGVSGANSDGLDPSGFERAALLVPPPEDFNGNNTSDVLFRNTTSGDTWFEAMSDGASAGWNQIGGSNTSYSVAGTGDFYGTGGSDVLFRNNSTGDTWFEAISNGAFIGWHQIGGSDTGFSVAGLGDFTGYGTSDILFRNNSTGDTWFEAISNGAFNGWHQIGGLDTHYSVIGVGDFFESGTDDILFRNNSTGDTWIEAITNGASAGWDHIGGSDTTYSVVGVGDFFGNGTDDILFRNNSTGDTWFEAISSGAFAGWNQIGGSDTTYSVVGIGDYFGNNTSDILFRNSAGDTWFEAISNGAFAGWDQIGGSSTSYSVPITVGPPALT
jgi:hypothetical protein